MKAIIIIETGSGRSFALADVVDPLAGPNDLLVGVHFAGLNRTDLALSQSHYSSTSDAPIVGGAEMSGVVISAGADCTGFAPGDRVMGLCKGSFAEQAVIDHRLAMRVPDGLDMATAAALPGWYMTAHNAVANEGRMERGATVLIQGATAGVGIAAARIARLLGAGEIIGVSRSGAKLARLGDLFDVTMTTEAGWSSRVIAHTEGRGVDLVIDLVGGGVLDENIASARLGGRIVAVGRMGGDIARLDLDQFAMKRLTLVGTTFRTRSLADKAQVARAFERGVLPAIADGRFRPMIGEIFPLEAAVAAQQHVKASPDLGKTLLRIGA